MRTAIYPGTFDPITYGHMDIIKRGLKIVDRLVVGVAADTSKEHIFPLDVRAQMVQAEVDTLPNGDGKRIAVKPFKGLLVKFAESEGATILLRGLRAVSDFEYEFQMACMNSRLNPAMETLFLTASEQMQFVSSRFVKQISRLGGDISSFVSPRIAAKLKEYTPA